MAQWVWLSLVVHVAVAGSMATVGSLNLQWFHQDRSQRLMGSTGLLCCGVTLVLIIGGWGLSFPSSAVWHVVLPVRALLIGAVAAIFLNTLSELVKLPAVRVAVLALLAFPVAFVICGLTGGSAYTFADNSPWPTFQPIGNALIGASLLVVAYYTGLTVARLTGARRWQLAAAMTMTAGTLAVAALADSGVLREAMTTLWTVPIAVLLAWWSSTRVLNLQGSLLSAEAGWREAERVLHYQNRHDQLTGLPNRAAAAETLQALIDETGPDHSVMVSKVRVNRLEHIRAADGPHIADQVLQAIAEHLVAVLPDDAVVARDGEATFLVMTKDIPNRPPKHLENTMEQAVLQLRRAALLPTELSVVVGVAVGGNGMTGDDLLEHAGVAVIAAEQARRPVQVYRPEMREGIVRRARTVRLLTAAIDRDEFELHYQPVVETTTSERVGVEALVRWRHHGRLHPPAEWIPIAEQQGLMPAIGIRVLRIAARDQALLGCPIAVNVSPRQLAETGFAGSVMGALGDCPPAAVTLEITENSMMADMDQARESLGALRRHGVRIALDDFGTEYSSLSRLAVMPFDILKIDRSFVTQVLSAEGRAMVTAIHAMARALGKVTVAEGVETYEQLQMLKEIGCDRVQGFFTGRPVPLAELIGISGSSSFDPANVGRHPSAFTPGKGAPIPEGAARRGISYQ